jgi:HAD superfamily hydrolase (TIGR01509 family)
MTGVRAVLWDMDGTLVDSERLWDVSLAELAARLGGSLSQEAREAMVGGSLAVSCARVLREVGRPDTPDAVAEAGEWLMARTGELFAEDLRWQPGAREALLAVGAAGLPAALVTSTHRSLTERALDRIGRDHFGAVVCGDEVSAPKPAPDPYLRAARLLGVPAEACVAVEDSPTGTESAAAAGCAVLVVSSGVPVPAGPRRVPRDGLVGLTVAELHEVWSRSRVGEDHLSRRRAHSARRGPPG